MSHNEGPAAFLLPSELWNIIFLAVRDYNNTGPKFERSTNITALLLTCRHFHDIGLPYFYERVYMIGGRGRRSTALLDALERDKRKRNSVHEIFLARWGDWPQPNHSRGEDALGAASEELASMERVFTKLSKLRVVYGLQVILSTPTFGHIIGLPTLRELHLHQVSLADTSKIQVMGASSARIRVLKLVEGDFLKALPSLQAHALMDTVQHLILGGSAISFYNSFRISNPHLRPKFVKTLRLVNVFQHFGPISMGVAVENLLHDCPEIEELVVDGALAWERSLSGLEKLKRFKGRFETVTTFCKGRPVEHMVLGPFTSCPTVADFSRVISCPSVALLHIQLWGIIWDIVFLRKVADACPQLEEFEPVDLPYVPVLVTPLLHLQRVRIEGRKILGQVRLERNVLQKFKSEEICPMLQEAQFFEDRYWKRKGTDCPWTMIKLSAMKPTSDQPSVLWAGADLVLS
ncbi:hypothetical protein M407DRAFT_6102 [Tulasnella calospora MUT 4182]|uniref:F-box domain-containing protein n=1 Tax=Tulasnella calospora MUT 4182 TaxID=1051891 RepID=A0A0C3QND8_9AGAM|nr:hypothetical protein M407DRAFT_6102 [Tulasnella calospora MUT 4182]